MNMAVFATSTAGLQLQLNLVQAYCGRQGLTVDTTKNTEQLLSTKRTRQATFPLTASYRHCSLDASPATLNLGPVIHPSCCTFITLVDRYRKPQAKAKQ